MVSRQFDLPIEAALANRRTTPDRVADSLREAILSGSLQDGEELNQVALAEYFNVSRVPIREALRQLQAEGLVRQEAHHRAVVHALSLDHILELFELRALLETDLLRRSLPELTRDDLAEIEQHLRAMDATDDHQRWLAMNREFHRMTYLPSRAMYTIDLADSIGGRTGRYLYIYSGGHGIDRVEQAGKEHHQIFKAIKKRDVERACALLHDHIMKTREEVERLYAVQERARQDAEILAAGGAEEGA